MNSPNSDEALADEIATLCGHLDAAEYRLLELIRALDERGPWGLWNVKSCAHWLNWRCGIALGAAREKVRVAHALATLPKTGDAFRAGRLSYSKVRAITRVATAADEDRWVGMALAASAAQIEKIVRHYRVCERLQAADRALAAYAARSVTCYYADDGCLVLNGRLAPEQGALLLRALERVGDWLADASEADAGQRRADALAALAERFLAAPPSESDAPSSGDRFQLAIHVSAETLRTDGAVDVDDPPAIKDGPVLAPETVRRLACDAAIVPLIESASGEPLALGRKARVVSPALRRALKRRDKGCRFPGCTYARWVDAHHVDHWADGGETRLDNLVLLCRYHHRLHHEGGYRIERVEGEFRFVDRFGREIPSTGERRFRGNVFALIDADVADGVEVDSATTTPVDYRDRIDYRHVQSVIRPLPSPNHKTELVT